MVHFLVMVQILPGPNNAPAKCEQSAKATEVKVIRTERVKELKI